MFDDGPMNFDLYYLAVQADEHWQFELNRAYGPSFGRDARYDRRGIATPVLRELAEVKHLADAVWRNEVERHRVMTTTQRLMR